MKNESYGPRQHSTLSRKLRVQVGALIGAAATATTTIGLAEGPAPQRRHASGLSDGDLRPIVCGHAVPKCTAGKQFDTIIENLGLNKNGPTSVGEMTGVFARSDGFVVVVKLAAASGGASMWERFQAVCPEGPAEFAIAITDSRVRKIEFEETYLLKGHTKTLDLTPEQRARIVNSHRVATMVMRIETTCKWPTGHHYKRLYGGAMHNALDKYVPGLRRVVDLR